MASTRAKQLSKRTEYNTKDDVIDEVRASIIKGSPLGGDVWKRRLIESLKLQHTTRPVGRPKNGS